VIALKRLVALAPVIIITYIFVDARYAWEYKTMGLSGILEIGLNLLPLYLFIIFDLLRREELTYFQMFIKSSFYVYLFAVLYLTIFFVVFRDLTWEGVAENLDFRFTYQAGLNLTPFTIYKYYSVFDRQIIGNLIMLLPLGIYLPLLYKKLSTFIRVIVISILFSISIESVQLISNYRGTDIDDVILNSIGAGLGFIIYKTIKSFVKI